MTPRSLLGLGVVTVAVAVAAAVSVANRYAGTPVVQDETPVFEGLEERLNSVGGLTVKTAEDEYTIQRDGAVWTLVEKQGYPVDSERARTVLFQLSQLRLAEAKTRIPERYPRLEVEDPSGENAKSARLTVKDVAGEALADVIVGKPKTNLAGGVGGTYLRKPDDAQAWLARGALDLRKRAVDWLVKDVIDIDEKRIRRIETKRPNEEPVVLFKEKAEDAAFRMESLPDGKTAKKDELNGFGTALSDLDLLDVVPSEQKPLSADSGAMAKVETFDGLVIQLFMEESDDGIFARFEAVAATGLPEIEKEAEAINARVGKWVYLVPEYKLRPLLKTQGDLIEG
ncbi:MAG: DUF4340 domain-containing protein [Rhodospirillales bacterium]|jgi:hypothetical protein|nr:DUF4340 domain-containing protein [Rhodospirillales bacterium]